MQLRSLSATGMQVSAVAMGCWPITGITTVDVNVEECEQTIQAAFEAGITHFDTAYCYGYEGESERLLAQVLGRHRDQIVLATKCGIHWGADKKQVRDGTKATIHRECEESLRRLKTGHVDLLYLHAPDPATPLEESAAALLELMRQGKTRSIGVSNFNLEQLRTFSRVCPITAFQPHYNMLQREIEAAELPWCIEKGVSVLVYWPLMKGLLAGQLPRGHVFDPRDGRAKYPMYQGDEWQKNQDFLDDLRMIAGEAGISVAQLVVAWTIARPGITAALCGARRPEQIRETAAAGKIKLSAQQVARIDDALSRRGQPVSKSAVT